MTKFNLSSETDRSKISPVSSFNLLLAIASLRDISEQSCSGDVARRALRLAELINDVLIPAVEALEHGIANPSATPEAALLHPSNGAEHKLSPTPNDCQLAIDFEVEA